MSDTLEIRVADDADRIAALSNAWEFWGRGMPLAEYIERRLKSPLYSRARRYVGLVDGKIVAALASYERAFWWQGQIVPGIAIGSVHTKPEFRGKGLAATLLDEVARVAADAGAKLSVLYCDIATDYYARRGYQLCPAWEGFTQIRRGIDSTSVAGGWRLTEFSADEGLDEMARLYAADHRRAALAVARDRDYWDFTLEWQPLDDFFWLETGSTRPGYVRMSRRENEWRLADWAIAVDPPARAQAEEALYRLLLLEAQFRGYARCGGWLPHSDAARAAFKMQPRPEEITMIKPLAAEIVIDEAAIAAADRFTYLDHV